MAPVDLKILTDREQLERCLRAVCRASEIHLVYAWAGSSAGRSWHWKTLPLDRVKRALIGADFVGSEPFVLETLHRLGRLRVPRAPEGTFHPKLLLGVRGGRGLAVFGSSNFTTAGFGTNTELNAFVSGPIDRGPLRELLDFVDALWGEARRVPEGWLTTYRERFDQRPARPVRPPLSSNSSATRSRASRSGEGHLDVPWSAYVKLLRRVGDIYADAELLRRSTSLLATTPFAKLEYDDRRNVAGCNDSEEGDSGTFGSTRGAGQFRGICRKRPHLLGKHLDRIPSTGEITEPAVRHYLNALIKIPRVGLACATRLLVSKRPDRFLCLNSGNIDKLREETGLILTLQGPRRVDRYLDLLRYLYELPWFNSPPPRGAELELWRGRVALVDRLVWRDVV